MRVVFMGTPAFALPALHALIEAPEHELVAVYSRPDAVSGRGRGLVPSPVKAAAVEAGVPVLTPANFRDEATVAELAAFAPDVVVVAAFGAILPRAVLDVPRLGCVNIHGSALPRWRGAAPIERAILEGDAELGVCIMQMEEGLDTGAFQLAGTVEVGEKCAEDLSAELAALGAAGLMAALPQIEAGTYEWVAQDDSQATYAEKIQKHEVLLDPALPATQNLRRIQASANRSPARCQITNKTITVVRARLAEEQLSQGEVLVEKKRVVLGCACGALELLEVKPEGKRQMDAVSWARGLQGAQLTWQALG